MGRKGKTSKLKPKPAPKYWPIHRKKAPWVVKPTAGPHSQEKCLPLTIVLREILAVAENRKEAKKIVTQGNILIDGKIKLKDDYPVGLMDVISMPGVDKHYLVLPSHKGLKLNLIEKEDASFKLCRIENKVVGNGYVQLNLHDGSNLKINFSDPTNSEEDFYTTFDVLKLSIPQKEILERVELAEGNYAFITGGKNIGVQGKIVEIEKAEGKKVRHSLAVVEDFKGNKYQTIIDFIFSFGKTEPLIKQTEAKAVV